MTNADGPRSKWHGRRGKERDGMGGDADVRVSVAGMQEVTNQSDPGAGAATGGECISGTLMNAQVGRIFLKTHGCEGDLGKSEV